MGILSGIIFTAVLLQDPHAQFQLVEPLPKIEMTLQVIVDINTEYVVIMETNPVFCRQYYGLTDFDTKTVSICALYDLTTRRKTLLHEFFHLLYWRNGLYTGGAYEDQIDHMAQELFIKLYGIKLYGLPKTE